MVLFQYFLLIFFPVSFLEKIIMFSE